MTQVDPEVMDPRDALTYVTHKVANADLVTADDLNELADAIMGEADAIFLALTEEKHPMADRLNAVMGSLEDFLTELTAWLPANMEKDPRRERSRLH